MEVSIGWQPCTCSLLICGRFYKAGLWMPLAWYRNCNYCFLAEMPSITTQLCCIQIKKCGFCSGFWDMDTISIFPPPQYFPLYCSHGWINPFREASGNGQCKMSSGPHVSTALCAAYVHRSLQAHSRHDKALVSIFWLNPQKPHCTWPQVCCAPILVREFDKTPIHFAYVPYKHNNKVIKDVKTGPRTSY